MPGISAAVIGTLTTAEPLATANRVVLTMPLCSTVSRPLPDRIGDCTSTFADWPGWYVLLVRHQGQLLQVAPRSRRCRPGRPPNGSAATGWSVPCRRRWWR